MPDLAVSTDIIVGFPGETDDDFERTLEVAAAAEYDYAYMFIFSPRPGTEAAEMEAEFVDPAVASERFERLQIVIERSALREAPGTRRSHRGGARRGSVEAEPRRDLGSHPSEQAGALRPAASDSHGQLRDGRGHPGRAAPPRGPLRRAARRTDPQAADPRRCALTALGVVWEVPTRWRSLWRRIRSG